MTTPEISRIVIPTLEFRPVHLIAAGIAQAAVGSSNCVWAQTDEEVLAALRDPTCFLLDLPPSLQKHEPELRGNGRWEEDQKPYGVVGRAWNIFGSTYCSTLYPGASHVALVGVSKKNHAQAKACAALICIIENMDRASSKQMLGFKVLEESGVWALTGINGAFMLAELRKLEPANIASARQLFMYSARLADVFMRMSLREWFSMPGNKVEG